MKSDSPAPKIRVMLADDEDVILEALRQLLEESGYHVVGTARDGASALRMAQELRPDVLLADLRMPMLSGIEMAAALQESYNELPVIILSAYDDAGLQLAAEQVPVAAYLVKGCTSREIFAAIRDAIGAVPDENGTLMSPARRAS